MNLDFNTALCQEYKSRSQIARVLTEAWVSDNLYCCRCGSSHIEKCENNMPVSDFVCPSCGSIYELKSKAGRMNGKIVDGAYDTMISRIESSQNPDFLFMTYDSQRYRVQNLISIPKHFFTPEIIEKRKPLGPAARRAGWTGCNILVDQIPQEGRVYLIEDGIVSDKGTVLERFSKYAFLEEQGLDNRGWALDLLKCLSRIPKDDFMLDEVYQFEEELGRKHPNNHNIRPKIRQQLQLLRDKGFIEFVDRGCYRKIR